MLEIIAGIIVAGVVVGTVGCKRKVHKLTEQEAKKVVELISVVLPITRE